MTRSVRFTIALLLPAVIALAAYSQDRTAKKAGSAVKADSVANMHEGITKDQADAILNELREIHKLLEKQQTEAPKPAAAPAARAKVSMAVASGWYSMGSADAPLTLVEFADYQCPFCKRFQSDTFAQLKKNYIDTGRVRFVSRDLPLDFHPHASRLPKRRAARASKASSGRCARSLSRTPTISRRIPS